MRFRNRRGRALSAMADRASELIELVRDRGVRAERLGGNIRQAGFFQADVATGAAVDYSEFGEPDLLDAALEVALQRVGVAAIANHPEIAVLIMTPLAEEILRGSNGQRAQENEADDAERAHAVPEQSLPERRKFFFHERRILMTSLIDIFMNDISMNVCINPATARRRPSPARGKMCRWR